LANLLGAVPYRDDSQILGPFQVVRPAWRRLPRWARRVLDLSAIAIPKSVNPGQVWGLLEPQYGENGHMLPTPCTEEALERVSNAQVLHAQP
jgi:hypothetical protein